MGHKINLKQVGYFVGSSPLDLLVSNTSDEDWQSRRCLYQVSSKVQLATKLLVWREVIFFGVGDYPFVLLSYYFRHLPSGKKGTLPVHTLIGRNSSTRMRVLWVQKNVCQACDGYLKFKTTVWRIQSFSQALDSGRKQVSLLGARQDNTRQVLEIPYETFLQALDDGCKLVLI